MKGIARLVAVMLPAFLGTLLPVVGAEAVPPLSELRKPVEVVKEQVDEQPVLPASVNPAKRVADTARLCPAGAIWYLAVPDAARFSRDWEASPSGKLVNEPAMERTFRNNRFGLNYLFSDLPESVITPERVSAVAACLELSRSLAGMAERMSMACYIGANGDFNFLFLFDIGLDRVPAFEKMADWETSFFLGNPGSHVLRGDHSGNFLDVWTLRNRSGAKRPAELAAGFAENMAVVSNDPALAAACLALLAGGENLADSEWGKRLAASIPTSASADAVAYLRMDALLGGLEDTPIAHASVAGWADLLGHGGAQGEAIYYGLQFTGDGSRETFLLPIAEKEEAASLAELLAKNLKPAGHWLAPSVTPYQPNPIFYFAASLEGRRLAELLRQEGRLFGLSDDPNAFAVPPAIQKIFTPELATILSGEIGLSFFSGAEGAVSWLIVLPCNGNPVPLLGKVASSFDRNGAVILSAESEWRKAPCWTAATPSVFRRLTDNFLLLASDGDILIAALDQLLAGAAFDANKDFTRALAKAEANQGMLFYLNVPEIVVRQYPNLSHIMRTLYPRSSGLNSRPPLALLRRYARGTLGVIAAAQPGEEFTRVTVQSPLPSFGVLSAGTVLRFPMSLRADGRLAMLKSRENLKDLWLKLQLYSSRFGHFPDSLDDLVSEMRTTMTDEEIQSMMTAPAARSRMDAAAAAKNSYRYLSGITPNDEPDVPILYETEPWSEDFTGMYPSTSDRAPNETGEFLPYRQMILLNGQGVSMIEKRFREKVAPRLVDRE